MNKYIWWILKKDLYGRRYELALYVVASFLVEADLALLWWPECEIPFQMLLWVFIGFVFARICHEDRLAPRDTCWWPTRPLTSRHIRAAKWWFGLIAVIGPVFVFRLGLASYCGFSTVSVLTVATLGVLPLAFFVLLIMGAFWRTVDWWRMGVILVVLVVACFLGIVNHYVPKSITQIQIKYLNSATHPPRATSVVDPWLSVKLPDNRVVCNSAFDSTFDFADDRYRVKGGVQHTSIPYSAREPVDGRTWHWYIKTRYEKATVYGETVESPLANSTQKHYSYVREGREYDGSRRAKLPDTSDGPSAQLEGRLRWRVAEIHRVWEGKVTWDEQQFDHGISARMIKKPDQQMGIQLLGPVTDGLTGDRAFFNWFGAGAAVVVIPEHGEKVAVFSDEPKVTDDGWPAFSRRYTLTIPDPRQYFPESESLKVKIYSANYDGQGEREVVGTIEPPLRRTLNPRGCFSGGHVLKRIERTDSNEKSNGPSDVALTTEGDRDVKKKGLLERIDEKIKDAYRYRRDVEMAASWDRLREGFDASDSREVRAVINRLPWNPQMYNWLPDAARPKGKKTLRELLRNPPIKNPVGMLKVAGRVHFEDREVLEGLAWCFIHSDRLDRMFEEWYDHNRPEVTSGSRCSIEYLDIIPERLRDAVWAKTWRRVKVDVTMDTRVKTSPNYIEEALRRESADAKRVACLYMRRIGPSARIEGEHKREQYEKMLDLLRERSDYSGPAEEFESWFMKNGMRQ